MIADACLHGGRHAQRFVNAGKVVVQEVQRNGVL